MSEFKFITFIVGETEYAINIDDIMSIQEYQPTTQIPFQKPYVEGLIDYRHQLIIPVINMSKFFNVKQKTDNGKIIILKKDNKHIAVQVEKLKNIISVEDSAISENPVKNQFIETIVNYNDSIISVLKIEELFI